MLTWILSPIGRIVTTVGGVILAILAVYGKGRRDAGRKIQDAARADVARRNDDASRAHSSVDASPSRLRENDGYRRDN